MGAPAQLEHTNFTVTDPDATAKWMCDLFGWHVRWTGGSREVGYSVHVGTDDRYTTRGGLNHIAVVVDDIDTMRKRVSENGFEPGEHYDYEPGQRFYFHDHDGIEYEIVQYD